MFSSSPSFPSSSSPSVMMLHEQAIPAVASWSSSSAARHFPTSVLLQEQREEYRPLLHVYNKEETLTTRQMDMLQEKNNACNADKFVHDFVQQLHLRSHLQNLLTCFPTRAIVASSTLQPVDNDSERPADGLLRNAISLAQPALSASKQAVSIAEEMTSIEVDDDDDPLSFGLASTSLADSSLKKNKIVRSTRIIERQSKQRKSSKSKVLDEESHLERKSDVQRRLRLEKKLNEGYDQNDPLRLFLSGPESRQLLTREEESQLITQLQDLSRLEKVKIRLQSQLRREPTLAEWADVLGLSTCALQTQLHCGNRSKEKLFHANMRMVVHIAKHYQGRGLSLQDLFQEGSTGLMKSIGKFKPGAGCRFGSYAYWWIRHSIRKAIFLHSRTIRMPENLYQLLGKVIEAKKSYIQEGNIHPTKEELARRVGITIDKLETLLFASRNPISMQQTVWADQDTTFQEITADSAIEIPDVCVSKQLMRRHMHSLLNMLSPKEKSIIRLRYGIEDGKEKTLSDIGKVFGLTKERVRQLESRALSKLKQCIESQGLDAYIDLLI
ncbi:unnamed protein product [Sphenostylis stenocarpa]|uniref:RNA polymerase sigma-70 domain-containing protein n=1 Tax=Sphenostylis stenocarpa TaxID=92480 RepID=A0AA86VB71_9FABA|nr:unnamed protein product [Sphenostylis stenocarpa]